MIIKGWLGSKDEIPSIFQEKNPKYCYSGKSIPNLIAKFAEESGHGASWHYKSGLGGTKSIVEDVIMSIFFTDKECSEDDAVTALCDKMEGTLETDVALVGYSEYTITGYDVKNFSIGGHNLDYELSEHYGQYMIMSIEFYEPLY